MNASTDLPADAELSDGGIAAPMPAVDTTFRVAPTPTDGFNVLQQPFRPTACWRLEDHRFAFGSSFPSPGGQNELALLAALRPPGPGAGPTSDQAPVTPSGDLLALFGHADRVGSDDDNKILSGRRATAVYGILVRDTSLWEELYSNPHGSDAWGVKHVQMMLQALQRFSMTRNERGCLSFAKRVNGGDHDRAVLAGPS